MSTLVARILASALALLGSGCGEAPTTSPVRASPERESARVIECSSHNVIGVLRSAAGECSLAGALPSDWRSRKMFEDASPELAAWTESPPGELGRYCLFEFVGAGAPDRQAYDALREGSGAALESVAPDCRSQASQGEGLNDPKITAALARSFHTSIRRLDAAALAPTTAARAFARVAIVDTLSQAARDDPSIAVAHEHGRIMGEIVGDIACPEGDAKCLGAIRHHMAMPRKASDPADWIHGGTFGTMGDAAMAIVAAVGHWRMARLADPQATPRLVINLSLGWVPEPPEVGALARGPVRAFEEALMFAACNGALVLAASGNVADPARAHEQPRPLAPAIFEEVTAPDAATCSGRGYAALDPEAFPVFGDPRPLVYAVGGLDERDRPLANARPGSMPPLAAYAANAAVPTSTGYTTPLTGTSVSTAVVAATAALLWSYEPTLTPAELMQRIYDSGYETAWTADFDFGGRRPPVRRVSVCAALEHACSRSANDRCPTLDCPSAEPSANGNLDEFFTAVDAALADPTNVVRVLDGNSGRVEIP
jgi:hypothetical protein